MSVMHWLSYGGGVNSTALAVLLCEGMLPSYTPWRCVWADTKDEKDETYAYIFGVFLPYLRRHGMTLETVCDEVSVLERWERYNFVGSRMLRSCSDNAKVVPVKRHIEAHGKPDDIRIIGFDAGESHRAKGLEGKAVAPLIEMEIDREGCEKIIRDAGLEVPPKSGCWHCPFSRTAEVLTLAREQPCKMQRIARLEEKANAGRDLPIYQFRDKPATFWLERANAGRNEGDLFEAEADPPCVCFDGG
jgi:hypothetical protein